MKFSNLGRLAVGLAFLLFSTYTFAKPPAVSYHLLKKVPLAAAPAAASISITSLWIRRAPRLRITRDGSRCAQCR